LNLPASVPFLSRPRAKPRSARLIPNGSLLLLLLLLLLLFRLLLLLASARLPVPIRSSLL
jgi:hypothetical protein